MRVSELADVAGVSVRTIRHYHAIGLMPVPPRAGAWRDYGVDDASRLLRIRALADAGIALADPGWTEEQARELVVAAYPARGQRRFVEIAFERLATYIEEYTRG